MDGGETEAVFHVTAEAITELTVITLGISKALVDEGIIDKKTLDGAVECFRRAHSKKVEEFDAEEAIQGN